MSFDRRDFSLSQMPRTSSSRGSAGVFSPLTPRQRSTSSPQTPSTSLTSPTPPAPFFMRPAPNEVERLKVRLPFGVPVLIEEDSETRPTPSSMPSRSLNSLLETGSKMPLSVSERTSL